MHHILNPSHFNLSTSRLLTMVELMSQLSDPIRLCDLAIMLAMSESTLSRFLSTLQQHGYATQDADTGRYALTSKWCGISNSVANNRSLNHIALPYLKAFCNYFGETISLAVLHDLSTMYIYSVEAKLKTLNAVRTIGSCLPLHCTCEGKVLLFSFSQKEVYRMIARCGLTAHTSNTITTPERLLVELENIKKCGYALEDQEFEEGVRAIAVPIFNYSGNIIAACGVCTPATRMNADRIAEIVNPLKHVAKQISLHMGWSDNSKK